MTNDNGSRVIAPLKAMGGQPVAIIPQTFEEVQRLAKMAVAAGLAPRGKDEDDDVVVAKATAIIMHGMEVGVSPMQSLQNIAVINGRTMIWGELLVAVLLSHGFKVKMWHEGTGDARVGRCKLTRPDGEVIETSFTVAQAKQARLWDTREKVRKRGRNNEFYEAANDSAWFRFPEDMLEWKALGRANRRGGSDATRGLMIRQDMEEPAEEMRDVTPKKSIAASFDIPEESEVVHEQSKTDDPPVEAVVQRNDVTTDIPEDDDGWPGPRESTNGK